jgi:hypothetical protein
MSLGMCCYVAGHVVPNVSTVHSAFNFKQSFETMRTARPVTHYILEELTLRHGGYNLLLPWPPEAAISK